MIIHPDSGDTPTLPGCHIPDGPAAVVVADFLVYGQTMSMEGFRALWERQISPDSSTIYVSIPFLPYPSPSWCIGSLTRSEFIDMALPAIEQALIDHAATPDASPPFPGYLCEACLDAPAAQVQPAPWGGEMGVCAGCAGKEGKP